MGVSVSGKKETLAQKVVRLEADLVGTRSALRGAQDRLRLVQEQAALLQTEVDCSARTIYQLQKRLDRRGTETLSDAELCALAAEVQAELTAVPSTPARLRLQAALRARGVLEESNWRLAGTGDGPTFVLNAFGTDDFTRKTAKP